MQSFTNEDYQIGIVCALSKELKAVRAIFDEEHSSLDITGAQDQNSYVVGCIGPHNVVAAGLPGGVYGTSAATSVAGDMVKTFPNLRFGLLVGIGGGIPIPSKNQDIRLGDVVVSQPDGQHGGVVQYDLHKDLGNGHFQRIGHLNKPPKTLLTALTKIQSELHSNSTARYLDEVDRKHPSLRAEGYCYQGEGKDQLYCSKCSLSTWWWWLWTLIIWFWPLWRCELCQDGQVRRTQRPDTGPSVHYGTIASANTLLKNATLRDQLGSNYNALCIEMEAAGIMDEFPCLVIRGICDYADAHKNDVWQEYAALTAAAFAKQLLQSISLSTTNQEKPIQTVLNVLDRHFQRQEVFNRQQEVHYHNERHRDCHRVFKTDSDYEGHKNINPDAVPGTCGWVINHAQYKNWLNATTDDLLWVSADPGCGKSVLSKYVVDIHLPQIDKFDAHTICYFFFKDNEEQNSSAIALCAILHQLFRQQPGLIHHALSAYDNSGDKLQRNIHELWRILCSAATDSMAQPIICILDALDECSDNDRAQLIGLLCQSYNSSRKARPENHGGIRWFVTSRPYDDVRDSFWRLAPVISSIRLRGEDESDHIRDEINLVIQVRMKELSQKLSLSPAKTKEVTAQLLAMEHRTYLWLYLAIDEIERTFRRALRESDKVIPIIPKSIEDAYEKILQRVVDEIERNHTKMVLKIIVGARKALTVKEMALALDVATMTEPPSALADLTIEADQLADNIRRWSGLFVVITGGRLYLLHQTAKEFLLNHSDLKHCHGDWKNSLRLSDVEETMARICVLFLCLSDFEDDEVHRAYHKARSVLSLFAYAAENWASHVRSAELHLDDNTWRGVGIIYHSFGQRDDCLARYLWSGMRPLTLYPLNSIHLAAFNGHDEVLQMILNQPHGVNDRDMQGRTALMWASVKGHTQVVKTLLKNGADVNLQYKGTYSSVLQAASGMGHFRVVELLLQTGADVNARGGMYGFALQAACAQGHFQTVQLLLTGGADANACGGEYGTALQAASQHGHLEIARLLLNKGAKVNILGGLYGWSPRGVYANALEAASARKHSEVMQLLLDHGAVKAQDLITA